jgi:hypothetical protein
MATPEGDPRRSGLKMLSGLDAAAVHFGTAISPEAAHDGDCPNQET